MEGPHKQLHLVIHWFVVWICADLLRWSKMPLLQLWYTFLNKQYTQILCLSNVNIHW